MSRACPKQQLDIECGHLSGRTVGIHKNRFEDKLYRKRRYWPGIIDYLGFDPFNDPSLGRPKGNESKDVAFLAEAHPASNGEQIRRLRLAMKKNKREFAKEFGISIKTLWGWETGRRQPSKSAWGKIKVIEKRP